jgi:adenine-specific DNA-methyltransferase
MAIESLERTFTLNEDKIDILKLYLPEVFADGLVNWEALKASLGEYLEDDSTEHFGLFWTGKREARRLAAQPSKGTLVPDDRGMGEDSTENIFIEGDNLEVLKLLRKSYKGRIKAIYIDPPYNTGNDFIYKDDYSEPLENYLRRTNQKDEEGSLLTTNTKAEGRFHSNWLNMIYPRLRLAKELLREDGFIYVSLDDNEIHNLKQVMNEVFGEENFISQIVVISNKRGQTYKEIAKTHEYLLLYSASDSYALGELEKEGDSLPYEDRLGKFDLWELRNRNPKFGRHNRPNLFFPIYVDESSRDADGYALVSLQSDDQFSTEVLPFNSEGGESCWRWGKDKVKASITDENEKLILIARQKRDGNWNIYEKARKSTTRAKSHWDETGVISEQGTVELGALGMGKLFDHPKPLGLIKKALKISTEGDDIVLDFFSGSGTTAQAIMELNQEDGGQRKFICVQIGENVSEGSDAYKEGFEKISEITAERIRRAAGKIAKEVKSQLPREKKLDLGFKSFRLSGSNFRKWNDYDGTDFKEVRDLFTQLESPLVEDWKEEDVITEIILIEGFPLNSQQIIDERFERNKVVRIEHQFNEHKLYICLDVEIYEDTVEIVSQLPKEDIFICLDSALTDEAKISLADVCRIKTF